MKNILISLLALLVCGCGKVGNNQPNIETLQSDIRALMQLDAVGNANDVKDISGVWKSSSSDSFLLIGKDGRAIVLIVNSVGNAERAKDGSISLSLTHPPSKQEIFGTLRGSKIYRQQYDAMEVYDKRGN
jgi:hypothetical protein